MILFEQHQPLGKIYVHSQEDSAVQIAANNLAADVEKLCGRKPDVTHEWTPDVVIAAGTVQHMTLPDAVNIAALRDEQGKLRWEAYLQQSVGGVLYLVGADRRGAVYALYDLCERWGVSPWTYMADVSVKVKDSLTIPEDWMQVDWPQVQYRGIFLNDEEELDCWARTMNGEDTIGPKTYERIFELLLRLKGNFIWPAMHVNAFNINEENGRLAQRMGVVTGTSHCDMLHRSNQNEWKHFLAKKGYEGIRYDYTIPGENREKLLEYWRESLQQNRDNECCYTIGMRGIHDSGFVTENLTDGAPLSEEELMRRKRELLEEIMAAQRQLIREEIPGEHVPQSFVPYKEVLPIYDSGLNVPEDVALIWVDDNHGYVRRYPDAAEQQRLGGNGLYYHSSYWAPPGMSWLFVCSIPLAHMGNELKKCYEQQIRRIWVDNVGALKPIEWDMEYFLRCGWDAGREDSVMLDAHRFAVEWVNRNFSGEYGEEVAEIDAAFRQLSNLCKPEHMRSDVFSQEAYGDEAASRLWAMHALVQRGEKVWKQLPAAEQDAFFQLVLMKMQASFYIAASYYFADRSRAMYALGAMRAADENTAKSREMDDLKRLLLHEYNEVMSGGKWRGILTPEDFPPPPLELYPACKPALKLEKGRLLLHAPDGHPTRLTFDRHGAEKKYFELLNTGTGNIPFTLHATEGIALSCTQGVVEAEQRIFVRVSEDFREGTICITAQEQSITLPVCQQDFGTPTLPIHEADGVVHFPAEACEAQEGFRLIHQMGRGKGDAWEAVPEAGEQNAPWLRYAFETFHFGDAELEVIRFLTLNSTGNLRVRLTVDDRPAQVLCFTAKDEYIGCWTEAAMRCGEKGSLRVPQLPAGRHTLLLEALDGYMTITGCNLYLDARKPCVLGPGVLDGYVPLPDFDTQRIAACYRTPMQDVLPPWVKYADDAFWQGEMVFARIPHRHRERAAVPRNWLDAQGNKDIVAHLNTGVIQEQDGHLAWEAENVLTQSHGAWMTAGADGSQWTHRQAETDGRSGLAMCMPMQPVDRKPVSPAPEMNYRLCCKQDAVYHIWLLMKYDDERHFRCRFSMDGEDLHDTALICRDRFHTYRTVSVWCWQKLISVRMQPGEHVFSIAAETTGIAIDRIYMTTGDELPPLDEAWQEKTLSD